MQLNVQGGFSPAQFGGTQAKPSFWKKTGLLAALGAVALPLGLTGCVAQSGDRYNSASPPSVQQTPSNNNASQGDDYDPSSDLLNFAPYPLFIVI